jgi:hypothetical protein
MTANRPNERPRPFGPDELDGVAGMNPEELAAETRLARDIEAVAARGGVAPSADFADRVMGAIATEPVPSPVIAAGSALRQRDVGRFLGSLRDSFRVAFGGGFPAVVRAQAFALALLVAVVAGGSGLATAGALGVFDDRGSPSPEPTRPGPTEAPQSASPEPSAMPPATFELPTPSPDGSLEPAVSASAETPEPGETQEPGDDDSNEGSSSSSSSRSPAPTAKSTPKPTPEPTDDDDDDHETSTPRPSRSPSPSPTPHDDD